MKKILDDFVDKLDDHIKSYSQNYLNEIEEYNIKSGNKAYVCNERLLAAESNAFINNYLNDNGVNVLVNCSEFPIHINKANKNNLQLLLYVKYLPTHFPDFPNHLLFLLINILSDILELIFL